MNKIQGVELRLSREREATARIIKRLADFRRGRPMEEMGYVPPFLPRKQLVKVFKELYSMHRKTLNELKKERREIIAAIKLQNNPTL